MGPGQMHYRLATAARYIHVQNLDNYHNIDLVQHWCRTLTLSITIWPIVNKYILDVLHNVDKNKNLQHAGEEYGGPALSDVFLLQFLHFTN